ncbi:hypothetical protein [Terrabacter sp. Soil810]|uniref:hypothetical protein n=1 Tax=Terrabacter sp. Soil810 TaxID=1736418 RepID=UPI000710929D|nr:hypothetical protein [Terrabacter sp. Soil810]KRF46140.1 hypothetical protein ASG96_21165 [Terrabacter sp. Soil810]
MLRAAGRGVLVGLAWGGLARIFMRLLSTSPEFTWVGTSAILAMSAVLWGGIGLVTGARRAQRSRWWRLAPVAGLVLFAGPGSLLVPGAVGTAVALALHGRSVVIRVLPLLLGLAVTLYPVLGPDSEGAGEVAPGAWLGLALVVVATIWLGFGLHAWWRRWAVPGGATPTRGRRRAAPRHAAYDMG